MIGLVKIKGHWYYRTRTPRDLLSAFKGRREIKRALKAHTLQGAKALAKILAYRSERLFTLVRCGMLSDEQIARLVDEFLHETLNEAEERRAETGSGMVDVAIDRDDLDRDAVDQRLDMHDTLSAEMKENLANNNMEPYTHAVDALLKIKRVKVTKGSREYKKLCREWLKVMIKAMEIDRERARGNYENGYDDRASRIIMVQGQPAHASSDARRRSASDSSLDSEQQTMTLSELMRRYVDEKTGKDEWSDREERANKRFYRLALAILGDVDATELNRDMAVHFSKTIEKLPRGLSTDERPPYRVKSGPFKGKTIAQVVKTVEERERQGKPLPKIGVKVRGEAVRTISSLMSWAVDVGHISKNHFRRLSTRDRRDPKTLRPVYTTEELQRLIESPIYTTDIPLENPERFWVPLIGLLTGARLNEICSLYVRDVETVNGIPCFQIRDNELNKSVKNPQSRRAIPIHPTLIRSGFLDYVESQRAAGSERLWPNLTFTRSNGYTSKFLHWFGEYNKRYVTTDPKKTFHSFRHTLTDSLLNEREVELRIVQAIEGHKDKTMTGGRYGKGVRAETLLEALKKLDYSVSFDGVKWPSAASADEQGSQTQKQQRTSNKTRTKKR